MGGNETAEISVGEIAAPIKNALVGGPFGSDLGTADYVASGVPVIRGQNLSNGKFVGGEFVFVSEEKADKLKSNLARPGDLVFTQRGNAVLHGGQVAIVPDKPFERYLVSQSQMKLTPDQTKVESRFLYFVFTSKNYRHYLRSNAVVTGVPHINLGLLREYPLSLPPLTEQKAIAEVLGALDDKIELNRRMNATLEAMARALFQSWFVDFDPVRAKLDGRKPVGMDEATAALFPDSFEDNEAGHIPRGWEERTIESVCKTVTRGVTPEYGEGTGRFIINQRVNRGSDLDWSSLKELSQGLEVPPERFAKRWDVLVNCLGEGTLGRIHLYKGESDVYAIDQHMSICRAEHRSGGAYIYQVLSGADGQAKIECLKTGSTGMTMFNISKLRTFDLVWPSADILAAYFKTVEPLWLKIANNDQESRTLATLRDTLLPKLLSGELSTIKDVSK